MNHFNWKAHKYVQTGHLGHINDVQKVYSSTAEAVKS